MERLKHDFQEIVCAQRRVQSKLVLIGPAIVPTYVSVVEVAAASLRVVQKKEARIETLKGQLEELSEANETKTHRISSLEQEIEFVSTQYESCFCCAN